MRRSRPHHRRPRSSRVFADDDARHSAQAVNTRDRNFTEGKVDKRQKQIEESIQRYLNALETADRTQPAELEAKTTRLQDKIARLREHMRNLEQIKEQLKTQPDGQLSMTDPDARSMATSGKGSGMVGYNVQMAVDAKHHLIVAHEEDDEGNGAGGCLSTL
jgi:chromosome segregation ATPase